MVGDNIKKLRDLLGLTQQKFAERIGIKQNTVASAESNKRNLSRQALMSICREFGVRLEWLETGEGEMYAERDTSILAQLEASGALSKKGRELIELYLKLPQGTQDLIADAIAAAAKLFPRQTEVERRKPDDELTPDEAADIVREEMRARQAAAKRGTTTSSAFTGTSGTKRYGSGS